MKHPHTLLPLGVAGVYNAFCPVTPCVTNKQVQINTVCAPQRPPKLSSKSLSHWSRSQNAGLRKRARFLVPDDLRGRGDFSGTRRRDLLPTNSFAELWAACENSARRVRLVGPVSTGLSGYNVVVEGKAT